MSGAADFFTHKDMVGDIDLYEGKVPVERVGYMTEMLTARAIDYIKTRAVKSIKRGVDYRQQPPAKPFYLSLHYTAPHWPWEAAGDKQPHPELRGPAAFRSGGSLKTYASMMKSLDDGIGEVLKALAEAGLERDTIVIFTSDNGGERFSYHWPFVGQKNSLWEGGIRVPAIIRWPGKSEPQAAATGSPTSNVQSPISNIVSAVANLHHRATPSVSGIAALPPAGRIIDQPIITMDWTATILAAAQTKPDPNYPLDGIDLSPIIRSPTPNTLQPTPSASTPTSSPRTFFWRNANQDAALRGPWKYLNDGTREYLFNLSIDQREQADFRNQQPEIFNELRTAFKTWEATVLARPSTR